MTEASRCSSTGSSERLSSPAEGNVRCTAAAGQSAQSTARAVPQRARADCCRGQRRTRRSSRQVQPGRGERSLSFPFR